MTTSQLHGFGTGDRHGRTGALLVTWIASACFLALTMDRDLGVYDEGIVLSDAMRVGAGDVIHRDFYSPYGPAAYYLVAGLLRLFPMQFMAERLYSIAVLAGIVTLTAATLLHRIRLPFALLGTMVCLGVVATLTHLVPQYPSLLLGIGASLLIVSSPPSASSRRTRHLLLAGGLAGLDAYFRYDMGLLLFVSNLGAIAVLAWMERPVDAFAAGLRRSLFLYALGTTIVFLPGMLAYLAVAPISAFVADIVEYGSRYYGAMRNLPFPPLGSASVAIETIDVYLPFAALVALIIEVACRLRPAGESSSMPVGTRILVVFGLFGAAMIVKGWVRVSPLHMNPAIVPGLIVLCVCADRWWTRGWPFRFASAAATLCVLVPGAGAAQSLLREIQLDPPRMVAGWLLSRAGIVQGDDPRLASCAQSTTRATALWPARVPFEYAATAAYLRRYTTPDERILVALDRHDRIFVNSLLLYFMTDRLPATHWHQFDPGQQTRAEIQTAMVDELQTRRTAWVVRDASFSRVSEPNESSRSSGVHLLDDYLDREFRAVAVSGKVSIWLRNGIDAPATTLEAAKACMPGAVITAPGNG